MGAHNEQGGIVLLGLGAQLVGGVALAQHILQFDVFQQVSHSGVAALDLGADGAFVLVLLFHIYQPDVAQPAVCNVNGQIDGIGRTGRKIESNNYSVHVFGVL